MRAPERVVVIGAGAGGLAAAVDLARRGLDVTVIERAPAPGGKMRQVTTGGRGIDAGPTVFTMRWVFEALFADAGADLTAELDLTAASVLARHAWSDGGRLDLFASVEASTDAIAAFAGARDAAAYRTFVDRSAAVYGTLRDSFIAAARPSPLQLAARVGFTRLADLWRTAPFRTLWSELATRFADPRLRQLFGRYATYVGASPMQAPATLMLIAHVEQDGVWLVDGGMAALAAALARVATARGARFRHGVAAHRIHLEHGRVAAVELADGERLRADAVIFNGDASALAGGLLGEQARDAARRVPATERSLSAVTWCLTATPRGFPLAYHNVFFGDDYDDEFDAVFRRRTVCASPTVYVCAQDRVGDRSVPGRERLLLLVNAPADGDRDGALPERLVDDVELRMLRQLAACGLKLSRGDADGFGGSVVRTTPRDFETLFPGSGGALYGRANHGPFGSFARPGAATPVGGLFLAGGTAHPGAGVPMATLSGRIAAAAVLGERGLPRR